MNKKRIPSQISLENSARKLDQVYAKLLQWHKQLLEEGNIISSDAIKPRYLGEEENSKTLLELISYYNSNNTCQPFLFYSLEKIVKFKF